MDKTISFLGNLLVAYRLKLLTGLHIGGMKSSFEIGSLDNPVIKLPESVGLELNSFFGSEKLKVEGEKPYIPGSSIKGKLRSLLEWKYGKIEKVKKGNDESYELSSNKPEIFKLFGITPDEFKKKLKNTSDITDIFPIRGRFFDLYITDNFEDTEVKPENAIDRLTARANPRFIERVPAGTTFEGLIVIKLFSEDDVDLLSLLAEGFSLLEDDYLGGSGSRGYGRVKLEKVKVLLRPKSYYEKNGGREEEIKVGNNSTPIDYLKGAVEEVKELLKKQGKGGNGGD